MAQEKDEYWLATNTQASARLNLQHLWNHLSCGYLIHPDIAIKPDAKVADIGTGTGIWPISLSLTGNLPATVQLDGFDITGAQYPPKESLPANVTLQEWNVLDPDGPPAHLQGSYDLVNIRYFAIVVRKDNFETLLKNFISMLKPGGYLQWTEVNMADQRVVSVFPGLQSSGSDSRVAEKATATVTATATATSSFSDNGKKAIATLGIDFQWLRDLPDILSSQEHGLVNTLQVRPDPVPALRSMSSYLAVGGWEEFSYNVLDARSLTHPILGSGEELRRRIREVRKEVELGQAAIEQVHVVTIGQKPPADGAGSSDSHASSGIGRETRSRFCSGIW